MAILTHPDYDRHLASWDKIIDFYQGSDHVKSLGVKYLPMTPMMVEDNLNNPKSGDTVYENYLVRAVFPEYVQSAVDVAIGLIHQKPASIEVPVGMEKIVQSLSNKGESALELLARINLNQLVPGRCGLLIDLPTDAVASSDPYVALYSATSIPNWDESSDFVNTDKVDLVVLDETGYVREGLSWITKIKHRVLKFEDGVYSQCVFEGSEFDLSSTDFIEPMLTGNRFEDIPFIFVNGKDLLPQPDIPPLLALANMVQTIYLGEADYRYTLFMQSQETFVTKGTVMNTNPSKPDDPIKVGAGSHLAMQIDGDAKYVGVSSKGLSEQRASLAADRQRAEEHTGKITSASRANVESGEALRVRLGAKAATLNQIAITSANALERALKRIAKLKRLNPDEVIVKPNLEFAKIGMQGQELVNMMSAKSLGAPLSLESIHAYLVDKGLTSMQFMDEVNKIKDEEKLGINPTVNNPASVQPNNPTNMK